MNLLPTHVTWPAKRAGQVAALIGAAVVYRFGLQTLGFDAYATVVGRQEHFLDPAWLLASPVSALLHLHSQPPLLNFFVWLAAALPGGVYPNLLLLNALASVTTAAAIVALARPVAGGWFAAALAAVYLGAPGTILATVHPDYESLTAMGYAGLVFAFRDATRTPGRASVLFMASATWLVLLRASFSPLHALAWCAAFAWWMGRGSRPRPTLTHVCLAVTVITSLAVPVKNGLLYGSWGSSSWLPLNLVLGWHIPMDPPNLDPMAEPVAVAAALPDLRCDHGHDPVDTALVMPNGYPNFNSCLTLALARHVAPRVWRLYNPRVHALWAARYTLGYFDVPELSYNWQEQLSPAAAATLQRLTVVANRAWLTVQVARYARIRVLMAVLLLWLIAAALWQRQPFLLLLLAVLLTHLTTHVLTDGTHSSTFAFDVAWIYTALIGLSTASITEAGRRRLSALGQA